MFIVMFPLRNGVIVYFNYDSLPQAAFFANLVRKDCGWDNVLTNF